MLRPRHRISVGVLVAAVGGLLATLPAPAAGDGPEDVARLPWHDSRSRLQVPPVRSLDILSYRIAVELDFDRHEIRGQVNVSGRSFAQPVSRVTLDAADLSIHEARGPEGEPLRFREHADKLEIDLAQPLPPGQETSFSIVYSARPRRGLYFIEPTPEYPDRPVQAWTQGEAEDSRYWLPLFDYPSERSSTVLSVTVPERFIAISNGKLTAVEDGPEVGKHTFVWEMPFAHAGYLNSLAIGEFDEIQQEWDGIPVRHYVPVGRRDDGVRSFSATPDMMEFFSTFIGVRYPYAKYAQVAVHDFIYGGMENISATTQTDETLHAAEDDVDFPSDGLVAHELAHQWWGDYLTCNSWAHAWLNEGFATYFEALYREHAQGEDAFDLRMRAHRKRYLAEDAKARRPVVLHRYAAPMDLFDGVLYQKGAWVLHMMRHALGEDGFRAAIHQYAVANGGRSVETADLKRAVAVATGRDMDAFFQQWVYGVGHPELKVSHRWDAEREELVVRIQQTQVAAGGALFDFPLTIEVHDDEGVRRQDVRVRSADQEVLLAAPRPPRLVMVDPDEVLLKALVEEKDEDEWLLQLARGSRAVNRIDAAAGLARGEAGSVAIEALEKALTTDPFHGVRRAAAKALGEIGTRAARQVLVKAADQEDSRVRASVLTALGEFSGDTAPSGTLRAAIASASTSASTAAALASLAKVAGKDAFDDLSDALTRPSHQEVVRAAALKGMVEVGSTTALAIVQEWTRWGHPQRARVAATTALGDWPAAGPEVIGRLIDLTRDDWLFVRQAAAKALGGVDGSGVEPALMRLADHDPNPRVRLAARRALQKRSRSGAGADEVQPEIDTLREETRRLRREVESLREKSGAPS
ncbi:MAG: M1 family aminopeptidase [Acidobacteriota bacterium]